MKTFLILIILSIPAFSVLLQPGYFSMHDDQHIVRLFLLDQGIRQGTLFPRWVDGLGFGYGYPLYNFYPPFIYYVAELFHFLGFSLIWSIKLLIITGFMTAAMGMYLFIRAVFDRTSAILGAVLYTYFFYHSVTVYVRGALAEFISMSILPFLFHSLWLLYKKRSRKAVAYVSISFAALILTHPLIAFPSMLYVGSFLLFSFFSAKRAQQGEFLLKATISMLLGLGLSAFFWLPSAIERAYTMVDSILTRELASYEIHFVYPIQFLYSLWGYGGSVEGMPDGMTFQLGKIHLFLAIAAVCIVVLLRLFKKKLHMLSPWLLYVGLLLLSLFFIIPLSKPVWDAVQFLSYLQFPWRFLTFVAFFISVVGASSVYYSKYIVPHLLRSLLTIVIIIGIIGIYSKYFRPQYQIVTTDAERTTPEEIEWRISRTSFEFVPQGIKTTTSEYGTTILDIQKDELPQGEYTVLDGQGDVHLQQNQFNHKVFTIQATEPGTFQLNTYFFPGWKAYLVDGERRELLIRDNNDLKLITVDIPPGEYQLEFVFTNTLVRTGGELASLASVILLAAFLFPKRQVHRSHTHTHTKL